MKDLLEIAKKIMAVNPTVSLTGTLMLKLRGIDLGREPHDIDLLIFDYAPNISFPDEMKVEHIGYASDGSSAKFKYEDIIIDVLSNGEQPELVDGVLCGRLESLIEAKKRYAGQTNEQAAKHRADLEIMGIEIENISEYNPDYELPF